MPSRTRRKKHKATPDQPSNTRGSELIFPRIETVTTAALIATSFLSAFLLFQVQPILGKIILPWFGGSPAVWTTSMFFFQVMLLAGYCYAHFLNHFFSITVQACVHVTVIGLAVLLLPIYPSDTLKTLGLDINPTWNVIEVLGQTVGIQFFLLSTTAPLTQVWWQRISCRSPYWLYAVSNLGSLLALLSYPFLVEPLLGTQWQAFLWTILFTCVAILIACCCIASVRLAQEKHTTDSVRGSVPKEAGPSWKHVASWIFLSSCGSILLLSMTNHLSQNVAVVPFLWVMPLAVYLLTFILTFSSLKIYHRNLFGAIMLASTTVCALLYADDSLLNNIIIVVIIHLTALFSGCMVCHGELVKQKPSSHHLTGFYLAVSVGGAVGGFFVSILAPLIFLQYFEYPLVLIACWGIFICVALRDKEGSLYRGKPTWAWALIVIIFACFASYLQRGIIEYTSDAFILRRNFYGVLAVFGFRSEQGPALGLRNGTIRHGEQFLDEAKREEPTSYYTRSSGLGYVMKYLETRPNKKVGMLGLGVGTIAAYSKKGDIFRAYEINPAVIELATSPDIFSFWELLRKRGATGTIIEGDARLALENELAQGGPQEFDVLVLDVFSGDAIPVHLLTREAFSVYRKHVATNGVIAIHISNRHLDLAPVVHGLVKEYGLKSAHIDDTESESTWMIVSTLTLLQEIAAASGEEYIDKPVDDNVVYWTDDYSNILSILLF
ncbi:MAG: hypothetical protein ABGW78_15880 [Pirellulales bacterium]